MEDVINTIWIIIKNLHLWLIVSFIVCIMAAKEGVIQVAVGIGAIFFLILFLKLDVIIGNYIMTRFIIAVGVGLFVGFFVWIAKE